VWNLREDNEWRYVYTQFIPQGDKAGGDRRIGGLTDEKKQVIIKI